VRPDFKKIVELIPGTWDETEECIEMRKPSRRRAEEEKKEVGPAPLCTCAYTPQGSVSLH